MKQARKINGLCSLMVSDGHCTLYLRGFWNPVNVGDLPSVETVLKACPASMRRLRIQADELEGWQGSALPALLYGLRVRLAVRGVELDTGALSEPLQALLRLTEERIGASEQPEMLGILERVGHWASRCGKAVWAGGLSVLCYLQALGRMLMGRVGFRLRDLLDALAQSGPQALPIITLISLLVGSILAFVGSLQLRNLGAEIYIAQIVGVGVAREMAAMMTAIVMAGRTGAAFAAFLATMQVNEEVDALRTFGISPYDFLVFPRILALTIMLPLLYLYASAISIAGAMVVAWWTLGLDPVIYINRTLSGVALYHFYIGAFKSLCFGALIGLVSCHIGLRAQRNAAAVGRAATRAVVVSIVGIIIVDSLFAIVSTLKGV